MAWQVTRPWWWDGEVAILFHLGVVRRGLSEEVTYDLRTA